MFIYTYNEYKTEKVTKKNADSNKNYNFSKPAFFSYIII